MTDPLAELGAQLAAAAHLAPVDRYRALCDLAAKAKTTLAAETDRAIAEATDAATYDQVAEAAGISASEVNRRIKEHRRRTGAPSRRGRRTPT